MYTDFYNLKEKPFNLTPSPRFLYLGETHKEALALVTYGVMERKGFILLTGEVGTGKTTIVQTLLKNLDSSVKSVYLSNPTLSPEDFLSYVASGLGLKTQFNSKGSFLVQFEDFLQKFLQHQQNVLLIVDEAQKLSLELLEEVRLLSNMETADEKLINIFLVGQPELNQKLRNPECRPLLQRISIRFHINPLSLIETDAYIKTRLTAAGARDLNIFSGEVIKTIHKYAQGYPRMINILGDNALLLGYSKGKKRITTAMIKECYNDLQLPESFLQKNPDSLTEREPKVPESVKERSYLRAAVLTLFLFILFSAGFFTSIGQQYLRTAELFYRELFNPDFSPKTIQPTPKSESPEEKSPDLYETPNNELLAKKANILRTEKRVITVKPGDTLLGLAVGIFGRADERTLEWIQRENPEIRDVNLIGVGQRIVFSKPPFLKNRHDPIYSVHIASFKPLKLAQSLFERLIEQGYEAYILPFAHPQKGKIFRIAVGAFNTKASAKYFGERLKNTGVVDYAEVISIDMM
ncbi:DUF2075 domain-containing protein [Candidatus Aerophobetes bacterium]|uniref:DUF2075 domain-containing protein n=1 Tax=Aerophobetes bacterium TaxID=2030807 RepID=A0A523VV78_UNCAE|nr:MAG: DUF2075 domain-containing protein [Candidatus Aerophobetes bacterium]